MNKLKLLIFSLLNILICFHPSINFNFLIQFVFLGVLCFSSYQFLTSKYSISLNVVFYLFIYLFFGVAPIIQFKNSILFFGQNSPFSLGDFFYGGLFSLAIMLIYYFCHHILKKKIRIKNPIMRENITLSVSDHRFYITIVILIITFIGLNYFDYNQILFRNLTKIDKSYVDYLIIFLERSLSLIPLMLLLFIKIYSNKRLPMYELTLILIIVFLNFPTAISRYQLALVYFTLTITYFTVIKRFFVESLILGILIVFPYFHNFRYGSSLKRDSFDSFIQFKQRHFDTFQNTLAIITEEIVTNGKQLVGDLFFFLPKEVWRVKPMTTPEVLCSDIGYDGFCNIAVSFFGEGYINFGFAGIVIFIIFLAIYNATLDSLSSQFQTKGLSYVLYFILIIHEFYLIRGSFGAAFIKLCIIIFAYLMFLIITRIIFLTPLKKSFFV